MYYCQVYRNVYEHNLLLTHSYTCNTRINIYLKLEARQDFCEQELTKAKRKENDLACDVGRLREEVSAILQIFKSH